MRDIKHRINNYIDRAIKRIDTNDSFSTDEQKKELVQLRQEFNKLIQIVELAEQVADIGLWEYDIEDDAIRWSEETYRIWRYSSNKVIPSKKHFEDRIHPEDMERVKQQYKQSLTEHQDYHIIYRLKFPDDSIKFVEAFGKHLYDDEGNPISTIGTNQNVTEREREKRDLETSLDKHRTSLNEIHHRVKNNLGFLAGTMQLQLLEEGNQRVKNTLLESTNRIRTIANVHEQLYQSTDINELPLGKSIEKIATDLIQAMPLRCDVQLTTEYDEIYLNNEKNMSCSLLVNEVITNALKHAFDKQECGEISIRLTEEDGQIQLSISDDGKGLPDNLKQQSESSLGMDLINSLCQQLDASHRLESSNDGTHFAITFAK